MRKFFRKFIWIHIFIAGNQQFGSVLLHRREKSRPFVFYPDRIKILWFCSKHQHYSCGIQSSKNIWFIFRTQLVLKCYCRIEHFISFFRKLVVYVICNNTVLCSLAAFICFFIADKNIIRFFFLRNRKNAFLNLINSPRFFFIKNFLVYICILNRIFIIIIRNNCII